MATTTIFGYPSSWFVYSIAAASLIETTVFISQYARIIAEISSHRSSLIDPWDRFDAANSSAIAASIFTIGVSSVRCMFAVVALIGQYMETIKTLVAFLMFAFIGILANIACGIIGMQFHWTSSASIGMVAVIGLHVIYLAIGIYICKMESEKISAELHRGPVIPGHVTYDLPVQNTINIQPTAPNPQVAHEQQHPYNPHMAPAPGLYYSHTPQFPPSYGESSSVGVITEFPPYVGTDEKLDKGKY